MSQRLLVLLSGLLLVSALASYVYYRRAVASTPVDVWALVPDDAVLVSATRDHRTLVRHLKETQLWDNLATLSYFQQIEEHVALLDSLGGKRNSVLGFLGSKTVLSSVHVTGQRSFDLLFVVPVNSVREHRQVRTLVEGLGRDARFEVSQRTYEGVQLTRVRQRSTGEGITYFNYRNTLVISANAELVESVVRRTEHADQPTVAADFVDTDFLKIKGVDATVLVNYRQLPPFLEVFFRPELRSEFEAVASLCDKGMLQMKLTSNRVLFNGFSNPERAASSLHQQLRTQPAGRLRMADVLSSRTAVLLHVAAAPQALRAARPRTPADTLASALIDSTAATLDVEAALCYLAIPSARVLPGRLVLVRSRDVARTTQWLGLLRRRTNTSPGFERVGPYQLHQAPVPQLAQRLLGQLFATGATAGSTPATALVGDYLVLSEDAAALRAYLADVAAEQVWSRSPSQVAFLQENTPLARLSLLLDTRNTWNLLLRALVEERRAGLLRNETLFKRFPQVALQFAPADNGQYYTQLVLRHPPVGPAVATPQSRDGSSSSLSFAAGLTGLGPVLMPAVGSRSPATVVQDRNGALHYVTPDNTVAWSDSLGAPLVTPPGLLAGAFGQRPGLLFATPNRLHLLDERGQKAPYFPLNLPDTVQLGSLSSLPAAEGQPAYLLAADRYSSLFLFNASGNAPAAWQPKRLDFALAAAPQLLRVGGRTVVLAPLENGYIFAYDLQGNTLPGFPISLGARLHTGGFVETGPTLRRTRVTVVNQHGELISFSLSGEITQRRRLTTWSRTSTFQVVPDQNKARFVVLRDDGQGRVAVFDAAGRRLLEQRFVTSAPKSCQVFSFAAGRQVLVLSETGPGKAYIYDSRYQLVGGQPFDSNAANVGLTYDADAGLYQLYRIVGTELRRTALRMN
ncbi:hypothetical protein D3Y59_05705 [Hymenobacter oligotrophus]|uniref:DUF3352 domain-containing protein n=1 Tax=Hymenobacter oligotrophus TaxID=2319843 RepID=A0A3B7RAL6_9BACT|nr:hypothetical protein [Hymenobacter oligotrophus]AYA36596.1 hypothetical protein D3Y59_05705 [Hymenobacter oligotrophus]